MLCEVILFWQQEHRNNKRKGKRWLVRLNSLENTYSNCEYTVVGYNCEGVFVLQVGDQLFGGIVFQIDLSGTHGLIVYTNVIQNTHYLVYIDTLVNSSGFDISKGLMNSTIFTENYRDYQLWLVFV